MRGITIGQSFQSLDIKGLVNQISPWVRLLKMGVFQPFWHFLAE